MREDMAKVIVERPRIGSWVRSINRGAWRQIDWDEQPSGIGKLRQWRNRKVLNENLRSLFRFLNSNVGQPWNDIYSEIRERINMNSAVQFHIWQHVQQYVCQHAYPHEDRSRWIAFYVEEATGLLRRNRAYYKWGRRKPRKKPTVIECGQRGQFRRLDGVWYNLIFKPIPHKWEGAWDAYFKTHLKKVGLQQLLETYGCGGVYSVAVLPVSEEQLKKLPR